MYFVAMALQLQPIGHRERLTVADGVYAHAAMFHALGSADPIAAQVLHDVQRNKCMTLALPSGQRQGTMLRITLMSPDGLAYAHTLIDALAAQTTLRFGRSRWAVEAVEVAHTAWTGVNTWADLLVQSPSRCMSFQFATPTAITKRDEHGGRFTALYPEPRDVFAGLVRRWQALHGPPLPEDIANVVQGGGCVVSQHHLRTVTFQTPDRTQVGFVGNVVYECRTRNQMYVDALHALTRLAYFSGVGYQTTRGMGAVQTTVID